MRLENGYSNWKETSSKWPRSQPTKISRFTRNSDKYMITWIGRKVITKKLTKEFWYGCVDLFFPDSFYKDWNLSVSVISHLKFVNGCNSPTKSRRKLVHLENRIKIFENWYEFCHLRRDEYFLHGEITRQLTNRKELVEAELAHSIACSFNAASNIVETGGKDYKQLNTIIQG